MGRKKLSNTDATVSVTFRVTASVKKELNELSVLRGELPAATMRTALLIGLMQLQRERL